MDDHILSDSKQRTLIVCALSAELQNPQSNSNFVSHVQCGRKESTHKTEVPVPMSTEFSNILNQIGNTATSMAAQPSITTHHILQF